MNFLILSVTAGEGHNSTARAIRGELQKLSADCTVLDTFNYVAPEIGKIISEGYLLVTEKAKYAYRIGYGMAEKRRQKDPVISLGKAALTKELASYINNEDDFDAIVFTHPFPGILLDAMLEHNIIKKKTVGILTDFTFHPYWEYCTRNNYVAVPDRLLLPQARRKGFRDSQIIPLGIPINPKFSTSVPKEEARRRLGLYEHTKTLLLMGGSMGYGNIADNVTAIDKMDLGSDFQMIIVCGNNDSALSDRPNVRALINRDICIPFRGGTIAIGGVDDHKYGAPDSCNLFQSAADYRILLSHFPIIADCKCDLMLSGHTHAGQINLLGITPYVVGFERRYPICAVRGLHRMNNLQVYVSRGIGCSKLPIRLGAAPEITLLEFR